MGLIKITGIICSLCQRRVSGKSIDQFSQADDGSILFWSRAYLAPESLFKRVLADMQGNSQVFDPYDTFLLFDQLDRLADEDIRFMSGKMLHKKGLDMLYPGFIVRGFGKAPDDIVQQRQISS